MKRRLEKSRSADVVISRLIMTNLPATDAGASMFSSHGASTAVACAPVRALVWHGPRQMAVESVAEPRPGDGEVLVAPEAVGICGSEVEGYVGRMANRVPPLVMGHEFAGTVVAAGRRAGNEWVGRRVSVNPLLFLSCMRRLREGRAEPVREAAAHRRALCGRLRGARGGPGREPGGLARGSRRARRRP